MSEQLAYTQGFCAGSNNALKEIEVLRDRLLYLATVLNVTSDWISEVEIQDSWINLSEESERIYELLREKYV